MRLAYPNRICIIGFAFVAAVVVFALPVAFAADSVAKVARIGFVGPLSLATLKFIPFWERLRELVWIEGQNLTVERRSAEGKLERSRPVG